ncbi:NDR1/HIN1-like protein 13 [Cucurbita maxima]|uniref:NDR1/HIN1-like protein 13 n=1 Tax=Cucurbita maxima TaxID=3661 RepID=A0A6J1KBM3_CUCMA|nr:NDR1/HIN1-like protein 13 [Cucurbita maxima]
MAEPERTHSNLLPVHPGFSPGTYVIQIPKDQIYRIPPPENAFIVECHRNPSVSTSNRRRSCCFRIFVPIFIVLLFILILALVLPPLLTPPKPPIFKLTKFRFTPSTRNFHIDLNILNPNPSGFIEFKSPSHVSLFFRKHKVAVAKFPLIQQEHGSQRHVALALHTKSSSFPKELERRIKNNKSKLKTSMSLMMDLPAHTKGRLSTRRDVKFVVICSFTVNTFGKHSHILSQDCQIERQ